MKKFSDRPVSERPREKLQKRGAQALSDVELLAVLLGNGVRGHNVFSVAESVLEVLDGGDQADYERLLRLKGVGPAKAMTVVSCLEFARRRIRPEGFKIRLPADVVPLVQHYADRKQEHFICVSLNGAHEVIATRVVSVGLVNRTQVHPREVFADPITDRAASIIVAHNHPSGNLTPSRDDVSVTRRLKTAGETLGIRLLDHLIFTTRGYYSFLEHQQI